MNNEFLQDVQISFGITNYLFAAYQGKFVYLRILDGLIPSEATTEEMARTSQSLSKIHEWLEELWRGGCLFSAAWGSPGTFESKKALDLLEAIKPEIRALAGRIEVILSRDSEPSSLDEIALFAAAVGRQAYNRDHYTRGFVRYGEVYRQPELIEQYTALLTGTQEEVNVSHALVQTLSQGQGLPAAFFDTLLTLVRRLPAIFGVQVHDINQLTARFRGGLSFATLEFTKEEAEAWGNMGFNPIDAGYWRAYTIPPNRAAEWRQAGINAPLAAEVWQAFGFDPTRAAPWIERGAPPAAARLWSEAGFEADQAASFVEKGISDPRDIPDGSGGATGA